MTPHHADDAVTLYHGDCLDVLRELPDASVDAVVTDPPYGLEFMGREWDGADGFRRSLNLADAGRDNAFGRASRTSPEYRAGTLFQQWCELWAAECLRVLRPGGHMLAFGGTRTWHRLACAVEDAGFEIRDSIAWLYGSGFPKSLDVSKAIDRQRDDNPDRQAVGAWLRSQRETAGLLQKQVAAHWPSVTGGLTGCVANWEGGFNCPTWEQWLDLKRIIGFGDDMDAEVWRLNGRKGTPGEAWEQREVIGKGYRIDRKDGAVPYGTGTPEGDYDITAPATAAAATWQGWGTALKPAHEPIVVARKPLTGTVAANVLAHGTGALNIDATRIGVSGGTTRDGQSTHVSPSGAFTTGHDVAQLDAGRWPANVVLDQSQAAQLDKQSGTLTSGILAAHHARQPKDAGILGAYDAVDGERGYGDTGGASRFFYVPKAPTDQRPRADGIAHPTVKPVDLIRWLVRLITPPGGLVLDPFAGSGTTGEACIIEGFHCLLIEREADYLPLILARLTKPIQPDMFGGGAA